MCPNNSSRKEISVCAVQAPQRRSCVESGEDGLGDARLPDGGGAFLRSLSRPNRATGWFDPATPLPDAEVSFLMGEVIHQAGMEQRSGFEPPLPVWKTGVLTVEH